MSKYERGTKLEITVVNGSGGSNIIKLTADGDWICDERSAKNVAKGMINREWKVDKVEVVK